MKYRLYEMQSKINQIYIITGHKPHSWPIYAKPALYSGKMKLSVNNDLA